MVTMAGGTRIVRLGLFPGREGEELGLFLEEGEPPLTVRIDALPPLAGDTLARVEREVARAREVLHHPHIQTPVALERIDGSYRLVLDYVDGESLKEILEVGGRLPPTVAARVIRDACEALHFAHEEDHEGGPFAHGWLLPENLIVSRSGVVLVAGFGAGVAHAVKDLLPWQSPEQVLGGPRAASRHSDIYGLGLVLHACLAGENPFAREPDPEVAILSLPPPPLEPFGVPPALAAVVRRALAVKAADRFLSAEEMGSALEAAGAVASPGAVAAWVESLFPAGMGLRALRQRAVDAAAEAARGQGKSPRPDGAEEVSDELILLDAASRAGQAEPEEELQSGQFQYVAPPFPPPLSSIVAPADILGEAPPALRVPPRFPVLAPPPAPRPPPAAPPPASAAGLLEAPPGGPGPVRRRVLYGAAALVAAAGLTLGWWLASPGATPEVQLAAPPAPVPEGDRAAEPAQPIHVPQPPRALPTSSVRPPRGAAAARPVLDVTSSEPGDVLVDGKSAGPAPLSRNVKMGRHQVRLVNRNLGLDVVRSVEVRAPRTALSIDVGKGRLTVNAPVGAEVSLDGRPLGRGLVRDIEIWEGRHWLTVTLGPARHEHQFEVGAKQTYEYEVTAGLQ